MTAKIFPNFFIIGAPKAGTTSLHAYIGQHPDVFMPAFKEPHFFDYNFNLGYDYYTETFFSQWRGQKAIGEATPNYLSVGVARDRMARDFPDARLLVILRDPTERAYSEWWMTWSHGWERLAFEDAITENRKELPDHGLFEGEQGERRWHETFKGHLSGRVVHRTYLQHGYYVDFLERYFERWPRRHLRILFFEDLIHSPQVAAEKAWEHLGVEGGRCLEETSAKNVPLSGKAVLLARFLNRLGVPQWFPISLRIRVREILAGRGRRPGIPRDAEAALREHYAPYNRRLQELLEVDLTDWGT